jgi:bifunctional UDP-N-acetylglucosamine pyrophosphorylase/glucosamine-1-phosphate N-acetyltransferase
VRALFDARDRDGATLALVTAALADPKGYGRILRDASGAVIAIREDRDCTPEERAISEVNPGLYAIDDAFLRDAIASLGTNNAQGELYLTDVVERAAKDGRVADLGGDMSELRGVNDRLDLAHAERAMHVRIAERLAKDGVGMRDPGFVFVDASVTVEPGAFLDANVHLRGKTTVRSEARIDVGCVLDDVEVSSGAHVLPYTVASKSKIGERANVGPFTHLRPDTVLLADSKVGNFCETKKTRVGRGSKVNHLAYVGDGEIGEDVNIGAGTIFCNYDGMNKHTTVLEDGVFIGSDSQLVAPVRVGKGAYVASGTTVTKDVPADALAISRSKQENKEGLAAKLRARQKAAKKNG